MSVAWLVGVFFLIGFAIGPALEQGIAPYVDDYSRYMRWRLGVDEEHKLEKQIRLSMQQDRLSSANALAEEQKKLLAG